MASNQDVQASNFEMTLRDQLMAAQQHADPDPASQSAAGPSPYPPDSRPRQNSHGQIDPSIGGRPQSPGADGSYMMDDNDMNMPMSRNSKRELSTTKRAAQNRAAQRAFRQRKEAYITKLEKQVKDYIAMEEDFKALTHENYQLRDYILSLQQRILSTSADLPPPPPNVNLQEPTTGARGGPSGPPPPHYQHQPFQPLNAHEHRHDEHEHEHEHEHRHGHEHERDERQARQGPEADQSRAPTAAMGAQGAHEDALPAAAVQQLRAAAAEADELGAGQS